ncbi:YqgF/RNase H-like domain-containing protein [Dioscorea alata]|uniref:YqgF/RNase H-like domain-containing protein n=1 Tax=Dioscorea alata TaxID=55571 RepID=A0ACB7UUK2_DIOAL|nr:YqgF/RNase H-like domain-containing protein [Dioscorea alata]
MGCHFSKKRAPPPPSPLTPLPQEKKKTSTTMEDLLASHPIEKKQVFLITNNKKVKTQSEAICEENEKNKDCCNKEEIDAILIQCGRLSRSSSGKPSNEPSVHLRKKSYDFDEEMEKPVSRPSPRRRTPSRERSRSKEGGRRLSRSPGRRSDNNVTAVVSGRCIENSKQPVRMVSVPPREKAITNVNVISNKRCPSPRSQSPGNTSRASFDYRRYPMAEIDGNARRGEEFPTPRNKALMSRTCSHSQRSSEGISEARKAEMRSNNVFADRVKDHLMCSRAREQQFLELEVVDETAKSFVEARRSMGRRSSSRRSSRDLDQTYAALLLEDIQNYHQQKVAHSVSSFSDKKSYKAEEATNDKEPFMASEVAAKDGYVSLRSFGGELGQQGSPIDVGLRGRKELSSEKKHKSGNSQPYASRKRELNRHQPRNPRRVSTSSATAANT